MTDVPKKRCSGCLEYQPLAAFPHRTDDGRRHELKSRCLCCNRSVHNRKASPKPTAADKTSAPRISKKPCGTCCDLPHRIEGIRCAECKERFAHEPLPELADYLFRTYERCTA